MMYGRLLSSTTSAAAALFSLVAVAGSTVSFTDDETALILAHGPWPVETAPDPSNRASGDPAAIAFGKMLFHSNDLAIDRRRSCVACHQIEKGLGDGIPRGIGIAAVDRNTMPLFNMRLNRWYGWDGKSDTLWGQSIAPILDKRELGLTAAALKSRITESLELNRGYGQVFGAAAATHDPETVLVNTAKALAAFQEILVSGKSAFDRFRDALATDETEGITTYPASAKRGLRIFLGRGRCDLCHFGPNFTNGEFHDIGLQPFLTTGRVDMGRYGGIKLLRASRYNLLGLFNDDPDRRTAGFTRHVRLTPKNLGEFRVPSLRNVSETAPYMHDGSKATLEAVVRHYSKIPEEHLRQDSKNLLRPLNLTDAEITDLVAFLKTL